MITVPDPMGLGVSSEDMDALPGLAELAARRVNNGLPITMIEVGSWAGTSTINFASSDHVDTLIAVDHWRGNFDDPLQFEARRRRPDETFKTFCLNMGNLLGRKVFPFRASSELAAEAIPFSAPLVYLDAGHSYKDVMSDIALWLPHVMPGGILAGHDYGVEFLPGVKRAVDEVFGGTVRRVGSTIWYIRAHGGG